VASVNWVFIGASNELGAFESGFAARIFGTAPSVVAGGFLTLAIVGATAWLVPALRTLNLETAEPDDEGQTPLGALEPLPGTVDVMTVAPPTGSAGGGLTLRG
jgi:hypothetical protein